ncbi:TRAP transporter substrate-binding protein [Vibrio sp. CK2-1]|uniref:TRAP transporter substrate-binding protein n=1 Tax=Vibrio sp. CK2-1 TaxID=2912249 RepID=UPI001F4208A0|nr:TRAP transporter substrate-binding protein [Vibrio sp. CK2-1]MCF7352967.1 TRAP transporter substrate-binding protein [Vibrio sp. CK2-1]
MLKFKKLLLILICLIPLQSYAFMGLFDNDKVEIKIAHYFPDNHPHHQALLKFKQNVEQRSDGHIEVKIFSNAALGNERQMINGIRNGTIQAALFGSLMQDLDYKLGFVELPFLFRDYEHVQKFYDSDVAKEISITFEAYGVKHLSDAVLGFREITSNKPINSPEDYKGIRLRIPNATTFVSMANQLGVNAQTMSFTEVFTALEQGVVDAQEGPVSIIKSQGYYEVQKYVIVTNHMFTSINFGMNKKFFEQLTSEQQVIIEEEAASFGKLASKLTIAENESTMDFFKDHGMEIIYPNKEFVQWNQKSVEPIYKEVYENYPWSRSYIDRIRNL